VTVSSSWMAEPTPGLKMLTRIWPVSIAIKLLTM
jgi:hypothetical protein